MTSKLVQTTKRGRGRPLIFDRDAALMAATKLFWERGYEGTSFDELIAVMGISASSFYNSFGSKERLYCEAIGSYLESSGRWFFGILNDETTDTRTAFSRLFDATAEEFTRSDHPPGCMISVACLQTGPSLKNVREMMVEHRAFSEGAMAERIRRGIAEGDVLADTDVDVLAAYLSAVARGLAVQARDGASRERMVQIGRVAMRAWPSDPAPRKLKPAGSSKRRVRQ